MQLRWWRNTSLGPNLEFARDRVVVSFLWGVGLAFEPQFEYPRKVIAKIISLLNVIDDVYDIYGMADELELFTDAVERFVIVYIAKYINSTMPNKICKFSLSVSLIFLRIY